MRKIPRIICVSPKSHYQCPYKRITKVLHRCKNRDTWRRQPCKDEGRDWNNAAKNAERS